MLTIYDQWKSEEDRQMAREEEKEEEREEQHEARSQTKTPNQVKQNQEWMA